MFTLYAAHLLACVSHCARGCRCQVTRIDFSKAEHQSADYLKINPKGRVPAMVTPCGILKTPAILASLPRPFRRRRLSFGRCSLQAAADCPDARKARSATVLSPLTVTKFGIGTLGIRDMLPIVTLDPSDTLPADGYSGTLAGRVWRQDVEGPSVVAIRADGVFDVTKSFPTMRDLCETRDPAASLKATAGERIGTLADVVCAMRGVSYYSLAIRAGGANETNHR